jgi:hypothetical protein
MVQVPVDGIGLESQTVGINPNQFCVATLAALSVYSLSRGIGTVYSMSMAKVAENPTYFVSAARAIPVIDELAARARHRPASIETPSAFTRSMQNVLARKRMGSVILYTMGDLILAIFCSVMFSLLGQDTQFAISVMGSLIGGFLGALLAAALIVDIYSPSGDRNQVQDSK